MANRRRLAELGMSTPLATETAAQIDSAVAAKAAIAALTTITTPDGSDATTTQALANATKAKVNAIIAALKA